MSPAPAAASAAESPWRARSEASARPGPSLASRSAGRRCPSVASPPSRRPSMAGKTSGADLVEGLAGGEHARRWLKEIIETLTGATTVVDAAKRLDCNEAYFYKNRTRALQATLEALEPRRPGRKPAEKN